MGRIPALDGLRAVAIAMVVAYHVDKTLVPAGHWGVPLFFVLSGFVITSSIIAEVDRTGRLDLGAFYRKRFLRLYPALLVVCAAMLAVGTAWSQVTRLIHDQCGSHGSCLHSLGENQFIAYARWPSREVLEAADFEGEPLLAARTAMRAACTEVETLHQLEVVEDLLRLE